MTVSLTDGLDADGLELVLDEYAKDTFGNHVVPGLAQLAKCRTLCKSFRDAAAAIRTVYDADIEYEAYGRTTVPVRFRGGLWLGDGHESRSTNLESHEIRGPALAVIRDKRTSRMFVVTASEVKFVCAGADSSWWCVIGRIFVVAQLAQLLGGHTSDWSRRLPNLHEVAYSYGEVDRALSTRYLSITPVDHDLGYEHQSVGIVRKNQLTSKTWHGVEGGGFTEHRDDFISHKLQHGVTNAGRSTWRRDPSADLTVTLVHSEHSGGTSKGYMCTCTLPSAGTLIGMGIAGAADFHQFRPPMRLADEGAMPSERKVHPLSRAFGWYSVPRQAEGPGWLVSLLSDQRADDGEPALLTDCRGHPIDSLMDMAAEAKEARKREEWRRTQPYHPTDNPTGYRHTKKRGLRERGRRAASAVALNRMRQRSDSDVEDDNHESEGSSNADTDYVQPKKPRPATPPPAPAWPAPIRPPPRPPSPPPPRPPRTLAERSQNLVDFVALLDRL